MMSLPGSARTSAAILLCALVTLPPPARADGDSDQGGDDAVPESTHPATDSPESAAAVRTTEDRPSRHKTQAFLIPLDERARATTARVAKGVESELTQVRKYELIDLTRALAVDATAEETQRAGEGRRAMAAASELFAAHSYPQAVQKIREGAKQLERGLPALDPRELAEAYVRLGAAEALGGDAKGAGAAFAQAAILDPHGKVDAHAIDPVAEQRFAAARADLEEAPTGILEVDPRPGGARVIVDGQLAGPAPVHMEVTAGRHFVRIERAGFYPSAQLIEVTAHKEADHDPTLQATPDAGLLNKLISGAAGEVSRGQVGPGTRQLAARFGLERALIGSVASHGSKVAVLLALVDVTHARMIARRTLMLAADGTDEDEIETDTQAAVRKLVAHDNEGATASEAVEATASLAGPSNTSPDPQTTRRPVVPGGAAAAPAPDSDDDPGLATPEHRPVQPAAATASPSDTWGGPAWAATARTEAPVKPPAPKPKKKKGIFGKTGTEAWTDVYVDSGD